MNSFRIGLAAAFALALCSQPASAGDEEDEERPAEIELDLGRSPEEQARAAVRRGDFRVARLVFDYMDEVGHISHAEGTPGVACDGEIGDESARELAWGKAERHFAAAYNSALLDDPLYPDRDVCVLRDPDRDDAPWPDFSKPKGRTLHPATSVNRAARASRPDLVRSQIAAGRPFDSWDRWHRRPIHWAARRGDLATLDILLAAGARTDAKEPASPVLLAADSGRGAAVERLIAAGASPSDCGRMDVRLASSYSVGGGRWSCPLRQAVERGFPGPIVPLVKAILARGSYHRREELGLELYKAAERGRPDLVRAFFEGAGAARDRYLQPSVMRGAAYRLDRAMLRTLLSLGGGWAARTPAEERLWLAASRLPRPEPLALLIWFGRDLNYLPAADRARLEAALPGLTAAKLRPFLVQASEAREKAWDSVLAGDLAALDALAATGVDFAERRGDTALSRAASRDSATVRWMLAHGARPDTYEEREPRIGCTTVEGDEDEKKFSRAQRETFVALCAEQESRWPRPRPGDGFGDHALATAVRAADPATIELLLPGSSPEAALDAIKLLATGQPASEDRLPLLAKLARLAAGGSRNELAYILSEVLHRKDEPAAAAILAGFVPVGRDELHTALRIGYDKVDRCRLDAFRFVRERGVDLKAWRNFDGGNLFVMAADCDSAEFVAFAATIPGIGINDLDENGRTPFESLPLDEREGGARKAMVALGAKSCVDLHDEESDKCGSPGLKPDPTL